MCKIKVRKVLRYMIFQDFSVSMVSLTTLGMTITCILSIFVKFITHDLTVQSLKQYMIIGILCFSFFYLLYYVTKQNIICIIEEKRKNRRNQQREMLKQTDLKSNNSKSTSKKITKRKKKPA